MEKKKNSAAKQAGLPVQRHFTREGTPVFNLFDFEKRTSVIRKPDGSIVFSMDNVEVPAGWSQVATDILAQKYFRKTGLKEEKGSAGENSVKQVVHRMAGCWKHWGEQYGYFASPKDAEIFYDEIIYSLLSQQAAPNSPQWFNTGLNWAYGIKGRPQGHFYVDEKTGKLKKSTSAYERPQPHACFILSVTDDLTGEGGIMDLLAREARIFKYGSGSGTNFSALRGAGEKLSGGGESSGLMSFLKIGDVAAGAIKSGGTTRRAAKMVCVDLDHPEIEDFIQWKAKEEEKALALKAAGYNASFEGEIQQTISGQNSNNSVRVPDSFFAALQENKNWPLVSRTSGKTVKEVSAKKLFDDIAQAAWRCADPGLQFDTTINEWHTCPAEGPIRASNPCSEYMFLDDTACNLASLNLLRFWDADKNKFDTEGFRHACRLWTLVLEISVLMAQFPSEQIAQKSFEYRTIGLGFANLGSLLMNAGLAYDSDEGRALAAGISALMTGETYRTSAEMASVRGAFKKYAANQSSMLRVIRNHRFAAYDASAAYEELSIHPRGLDSRHCPDYLLQAACQVWDEALQLGERHGFRNAQATVVAPTGTIGLLMDCDTTGVEPEFSLVKFKKLSGGGYFRIANQSMGPALKVLGYPAKQIKEIIEFVNGRGTFDGAPYINYESLREKGFTRADLARLDTAAASAFHISFIFNVFTLGEKCLQAAGLTPQQYNQPGFDVLGAIGFNGHEIEIANEYVCGNMGVEGAPHLAEQHLSVFDCANPCGKNGTRFLSPGAHLKMMAAIQPFISGAISKTVNLPHSSTVDEVRNTYYLAWKLGIKACALYRDGSKFTQPLSTSVKTDKKESKPETFTEAEVLEAAKRLMNESADTSFKRALSRIVERKKLPSRRRGFTQKSKIGGHTVFVRTGEYDDGTLGELFIDMHKEGASFRSLLNCFAISISIGLQYGVPLEEFVNKFTFTRFEPSGPVDHDNIKSATSVIDYIFRLLAWEYLGREDLVHQKSASPKTETGAQQRKIQAPLAPKENTLKNNSSQTQEFMGSLMGDAPFCDSCGHITVRSGTCYRCLNCGNSLGCS